MMLEWLKDRKLLSSAALMTTCALFFASPVVSGDSSKLNDLIGERTKPSNAAPVVKEPASRPAVSPPVAPAASAGKNKELWVQSQAPLRNVQLIIAQPEASSNCKEVIFKKRQPIPKRYIAKPGQRIRIPLNNVCWIGLRNGSASKSLVLRLGEAFQKVAIVPTPQLVVGRELRPHEQVRIALKPIPIDKLDINLEATWIDDINAGKKIQRMTFEFFGK